MESKIAIVDSKWCIAKVESKLVIFKKSILKAIKIVRPKYVWLEKRVQWKIPRKILLKKVI